MLSFLLAPENMPFSTALAVMLLIFLIELITASLGMGLSQWIDALVPDFEVDFEAPDIDASTLSQLLTWFRVGEVPVLMLFIVFLTAFGLAGLCLQYAVQALTGGLLPAGIAAPVSLLATLPVVRWGGGLLARYMPRDETYVTSEEKFIGRMAEVIVGEAAAGSPAQAKMRDEFGQSQYLMIEPDIPGEVFTRGDRVILVSRERAVYKAIRATAALHHSQSIS